MHKLIFPKSAELFFGSPIIHSARCKFIETTKLLYKRRPFWHWNMKKVIHFASIKNVQRVLCLTSSYDAQTFGIVSAGIEPVLWRGKYWNALPKHHHHTKYAYLSTNCKHCVCFVFKQPPITIIHFASHASVTYSSSTNQVSTSVLYCTIHIIDIFTARCVLLCIGVYLYVFVCVRECSCIYTQVCSTNCHTASCNSRRTVRRLFALQVFVCVFMCVHAWAWVCVWSWSTQLRPMSIAKARLDLSWRSTTEHITSVWGEPQQLKCICIWNRRNTRQPWLEAHSIWLPR